MLVFLLRRLAHALVVILCVIFIVSVLIKLIPGDPVDIMAAGNPGITAEQKQALREQLGLTRPLLEQFVTYLGAAAVIRASGTEPVLRIMVEARDAETGRLAAERLAAAALT